MANYSRVASGDLLKKSLNRRALVGAGAASAASVVSGARTGRSTAYAAPARQTSQGSITVVHPAAPLTLDPNIGVVEVVRSVTSHMYDQVIELTAAAELKPMLAESWRAIDPTTWEFKLRQGVTFHDGTPFNAEVLKFTLERIFSPDYGSLQQTYWVPVTSITIPDEFTCVIQTETPMGTMPYTMALTTPVHPDAGTDPNAFPATPIGTGPFKFVEWIKDDRIVMEANPDYWNGPPHLEQVIFRTIPELSTRMSALENGEIDVTLEIVPEDVERLQSSGEIEVLSVDTFRTSFMWMNAEREPFTDVRVRQAVRYAVNLDAIGESIIAGVGTVALAPVAPKVFGFNPDLPPHEYDPERARALLAEAGFPDGFETTSENISAPGGYTRHGDVSQVIIAQLAEVGIIITPLQKDPATANKDLLELNWDTYFGGATAVTGDADNGMGRLYLCSANRTGWCDDDVDEYLLTGRESSDPEERLAAYQAAQEILWSDGPALWTYHHIDTVGVRNRVKGFEPRPDRQVLVRNVSVEG